MKPIIAPRGKLPDGPRKEAGRQRGAARTQMRTTAKTLEVLYIGGSGRSGSTLLEILLGNIPGFFSVGEIRHFWEYACQKEVRCGCGRTLGECDYWSQILRKADADLDDSVEALASTNYRYNRSRFFSRIDDAKFVEKNPRLRRLHSATHWLYETVLQESGGRVLVDSSKVPTQLFLLRGHPSVDVRVLHLVRDSRAVAYAWGKKHKRDYSNIDGRTYFPTRSKVRSLFAWMLENYAIANTRSELPYRYLRYEDFSLDPYGELAAALSDLGFGEIEWGSLRDPGQVLKTTHSIGGNSMRYSTDPLRVRQDTEWHEKMPSYLKIGLGLASLPLLAHFGYRLRG